MEYKLEKPTKDDLERMTWCLTKTITQFESDMSEFQINRIKEYAMQEVINKFNSFYNIVVDGKIAGLLLLENERDGILLSEIFIEEEYRNKGLGTSVIKDIMNNNKVVYLWVYKKNEKALRLYQKFDFRVEEETFSRFFMKHSK